MVSFWLLVLVFLLERGLSWFWQVQYRFILAFSDFASEDEGLMDAIVVFLHF